MNFLDKDAILGKGPRLVKVEVPAWDGFVWVRELGIGDRLAFQGSVADNPKAKDNWVRLGLLTICDESGDCLFTDDDLPQLMGVAGAALEDVLEETMRLNGFLSPVEREEKKEN